MFRKLPLLSLKTTIARVGRRDQLSLSFFELEEVGLCIFACNIIWALLGKKLMGKHWRLWDVVMCTYN